MRSARSGPGGRALTRLVTALLHVRRLGYRPASLEIDLRRDSPFRVSVGLVVVPIALEAVDVAGASPAPIAILRADADGTTLLGHSAFHIPHSAFFVYHSSP